MVEVKADALEESFAQFEDDDGVAALKAELETLKAKIASGVIAAQRPALDGVKSADSAAFIEQYVRRGIETSLETKAVSSSSDAAGGYAVPHEIDAQIDSTLAAISPIRGIANLVKVGSAGYRKLVASGGTPAGWVAYEADRPETGTPTFTEIVPASGELYANRRRRSRCSTMRCSTSRSGSRRRSQPSSLAPRVRRSSAVRASTSRSAS